MHGFVFGPHGTLRADRRSQLSDSQLLIITRRPRRQARFRTIPNQQKSLELREREDAMRRAETRERMRAAGQEPLRGVYTGVARASVAARAFAALADNARDYAIFLMNPHGVITFWGEGARLIKWWTKDQAEGAHLRLLYPDGGSDDGTAEEHIIQAAERGEYTGEGMRMRSDGSTFWAGVTLTALRDKNGVLLGFAKTTRDLTARRAADALLQSAAQSAEMARAAAVAANAAKSGFLATISHEIRTPVNAILGYHQLLELEIAGTLNATQHEHLRRASASGRHLLTLITDVLDFSRLDSGQAGVEAKSFKIGDAVRSALDLVLPMASERGIAVTDAVSGYARGLAAWGDEASARQVLVNLLSNAVKFTEPRDNGAGRVIVSVGMAEQPSPGAKLLGPGPWVYVRIEDTGIGIPADRLESMFEPFVQGDMTLTRQVGGTGLGLAISRRLARLMRGEITAHSEPGLGSSFFLWLPAAPAESLRTGGLEGHGPGREGRADEEIERSVAGNGATPAPNPGPMTDIANAVLAEIERVLHGYVARLRSDPEVPGAQALDEAQLQDHLASFLADLASTLTTIDLSTETVDANMADGTAIQRVVAMRHGAQRARLGWTTNEIRREFTILREELAAALRRRATQALRGPVDGRPGEAERAIEVLNHFVTVSEGISLASFAEASAVISPSERANR
jgi:PAS domain S-box-containing protein